MHATKRTEELPLTRPCDAPDWRTLTREELDKGLNNSAAVPECDSIVADWDQRSLKMREQYPAHLDLKYGKAETNRIDFIKAGEGAPTLVFIHGGYWQMKRPKETFTWLAEGTMPQGINLAVIEYSLSINDQLDTTVSEINQGLDFLAAELPSLGGDPNRIIVSGSSAGGHLTAMALNHSCVKAGIGLSGLYDLEPIRHSYLNDKLQLDEAMTFRNSPMLQAGGPSTPLALLAGSAELPLLRRQTADFAAHRARHGLPVIYEEVPGANHFTIVYELGSPTGRVMTLARQFFERTVL